MRLLFLFAAMILAAVPATAATPYLTDQEIAAQAQRDFSAALDLWRDGRYEELYERTGDNSMTRERFVQLLSSASRRPACCWEKLQEVKVKATGSGRATIHAKVGLELPGSGTEYATRSFKLENEDGIWKMQAADILSLSGGKSAAKTKKRKKD